MNTAPKDNLFTIAAIGLLAYASADVAHHVFGHGAACLALGGKIVSLSSIFVNCSIRGATIDLAGPFANFAVGVLALLAARMTVRASAMHLFCTLAAAFNLLWFSAQLVFSAATRTDDWAWALHQMHAPEAIRYGMMGFGALIYIFVTRAIARRMAAFASPKDRARKITFTAWLIAGLFACVTAAFDHNPVAAILRSAAPQSFATSIGLLFVSPRTSNSLSEGEIPHSLGLSVPWIFAAAIVGVASVLLLGPGVAIGNW